MSDENKKESLEKILDLANQLGRKVSIHVNKDGTYRAEIESSGSTVNRDFDQEGNPQEDFEEKYKDYEKKGGLEKEDHPKTTQNPYDKYGHSTEDGKYIIDFTQENFDKLETDKDNPSTYLIHDWREMALYQMFSPKDSRIRIAEESVFDEIKEAMQEAVPVFSKQILYDTMQEPKNQIPGKVAKQIWNTYNRLVNTATSVEDFTFNVTNIIHPRQVSDFSQIPMIAQEINNVSSFLMSVPYFHEGAFEALKETGGKEGYNKIEDYQEGVYYQVLEQTYALVMNLMTSAMKDVKEDYDYGDGETFSLTPMFGKEGQLSAFEKDVLKNIISYWISLLPEDSSMVESMEIMGMKILDAEDAEEEGKVQLEIQAGAEEYRASQESHVAQEEETIYPPITEADWEPSEEDTEAESLGRQLEENSIINKYKQGFGIAEILDYHDISAGRLYAILDKHGVQRNTDRVTKKVEHVEGDKKILSQIFDDYEDSDLSLNEIYKKYNIHKNGLFYLLDKYQVPRRGRGR